MAGGWVLGVCVATKLLLLAWCGGAFAAMVVARRYREAFVLCVAIAAGTMLGTLPVAPRWGFMLGRLGVLSSLDPQEQGFVSVFLNAKGWLLWLVVVAALAIWRRAPLTLVAFTVTAFVLNFIAVRSNPSFSYLLPTAMAVVALFAASVRGTMRRPVQLAVFVLCALLLAKSIRDDLGVHRRRIADAENLRAGVARLIPPGAVVVYGWRFPAPSYALRVMTDDPRDHALVATRYPRDGHYTPWSRRVYLPPGVRQWDYLVVQREHLHGLPGTVVGEVPPYVVVRR